MTSNWINYFGYGSLVNRDTRPAGEVAYAARLQGWQRVWDHRVLDPNRGKHCTSLSIEQLSSREAGGIQGVVVRLPAEQLPLLDEREAGYGRLVLPSSDFDLPSEFDGEDVMVYQSLPENRLLADAEHPVLQSYIDCVMVGFLHQFGETGLQSLMSSTRGWECPIFNDREEPFYPRAVEVTEPFRKLFDQSIQQAIVKNHCA